MSRLASIAGLFLLITSANAHEVVIFGDSLSDTRVNSFNNALVPPQKKWPDYLKDTTGVTVINYARYGAGTGTDNLYNNLYVFPPTDTLQQISNYADSNPNCGLDKTFVIWAGTNDMIIATGLDAALDGNGNIASDFSKLSRNYFFQTPASATPDEIRRYTEFLTQPAKSGTPPSIASAAGYSVRNIVAGLNLLKGCGAVKVLVVGMWDLGKTPAAVQLSRAHARNSIITFNTELSSKIATLKAQSPQTIPTDTRYVNMRDVIDSHLGSVSMVPKWAENDGEDDPTKVHFSKYVHQNVILPKLLACSNNSSSCNY